MRTISVDDFQSLSYEEADDEAFRIVADLTCSACGAYQAADSDPAPVKDRLAELAARLFSQVGWRVNEKGEILCPECARGAKG